jgi:excisionase family DNA binding protein
MADLLTIDEAAAKLKLKSATVRTWIRQGKLKAVKFGRIWRIKAEDLEDFIAHPPRSAPKLAAPAKAKRQR